MKRLFYLLISSLYLLLSCSELELEKPSASCKSNDFINISHPKAAKLQPFLNEITKDGIPGVALAIYTKDGYWAGTSGFSKIETKEPMQVCHLQYGQSVAKIYMATAVLSLYDEGKVSLDEKITKYLPSSVSDKITDAEKITVRMLLNHTSGVPEYNDNPVYVTTLLQHPLRKFSTTDYLDFVKGKPLMFAPGSQHKYVNTNYLLLALVVDAITGDHAVYIREKIFNKQGLKNSFYHDPVGFSSSELVNSYWDRYSNGVIENCSQMQNVNVSSLIGDDGIIASPIDYVRFLRALFNKQILSQKALKEMQTFVANNSEPQKSYGFGLERDVFKNAVALGHSGAGIGASCLLRYFPEKEVYMFLSINMGTAINSPNFNKLEEKIDAIQEVLIDK